MEPIQNLRDCTDVTLVGRKAANLGALLRSGFVVPDGFVLTTAAEIPDFGSVRSAYCGLGAEVVAVRSSATIEDSTELSMAGQFKTTLNVRNEAELFDAIQLCKASSDSPQVRSYLDTKHLASQGSMAVLVQKQVPADVAGVLFTQAPHNTGEMLIEAAHGLGDDVVAGRTQPDGFRLNAETGAIIEIQSHRKEPCLTTSTLRQLWEVGRKAALHFGVPQDIEWAISENRIFVLQARPITAQNRDNDRARLITTLRQQLANSGGGPWILHNLAETVPHPTPLTWSLLRGFMTGSGGFGAMYRRLGFKPEPEEFLQLIAGRIYMDFSRAPNLFGHGFPFAYDIHLLRDDPDAAQLPPSIPKGSWRARLRARASMREAKRKIDQESIDYDVKLTRHVIPEFRAWCAEEKKRDLSSLSVETWVHLWNERESRLFDDFAPQILFTSFIAAAALEKLRDFVAEHFWDESPEMLARKLTSTGRPDQTILADAGLRSVGRAQLSLAAWLEEYGHRAVNELDLATPRWRETPDLLLAYAARLKDAPDPLELHRKGAEATRQWINQLPAAIAHPLGEKVRLAQRYLTFREDGKHYLMLGYDLLRDMVLDASHRLGADVTWLTSDELMDALHQGSIGPSTIDRRKSEFRAESRIHLPPLIDDPSLAVLNESSAREECERFQGLAISSGSASGPVRIVESPLAAPELGNGYVLICPSTDPQWTPLFLNASALILECGGSLSHGAIVAREMNLPAVVLPDATHRFRDGEEILVNGSNGVVSRTTENATGNNSQQRLPFSEVPPRCGIVERRAARWRNIGFGAWILILIAAWILPEHWIYRPALQALDTFLWPIVRACGRPCAVSLIAGGLALLAGAVQWLIVDNARMREVRRRSRDLVTKAAALPEHSPDRKVLTSIISRADLRVIGAGFVPIGILLGVFILTFAWLTARMNAENPLPGSNAVVVAAIDADFRSPVTLKVDPPLYLDGSSPATRSLPPIRETLERLASRGNISDSEQADLRRYLRRGVPQQTIAWTIRCDTAGSYPIKIALGNEESFQEFAVFGDQYPPRSAHHFKYTRLPLRALTIRSTGQNPRSWNIKSLLPGLDQNVGWPWIYLVAYLAAWLPLRRILRLV